VSGATGQKRDETCRKQVSDFESEQISHSTPPASFSVQNRASPFLAFGVHSLVRTWEKNARVAH
jgi:hypothetical protein